jgi:gamma-glutamylcyclotransferase (GGCT)/AIG2-like uncharacterized protein YtfP
MRIDHRLAVYGTLAPGCENHHQLDGLVGCWRPGIVRGTRIATGWGATKGYPALVLAADGAPVAVQIFESADLPDHWARLDDFEGPDYRRVVTDVETQDGVVAAWIYAAATD